MGSPLPFHAPAGTPLVGQPFTVLKVGVPMNLVLKCNCTPQGTEVTIVGSQPAPCSSCGKVYNAVFNPTAPQNQQIQMHIQVPEPEKVPS